MGPAALWPQSLLLLVLTRSPCPLCHTHFLTSAHFATLTSLPALPHSQVRQQAPAGFIGLWPEFSLLAHSCVPNTSHVVVGDRMLVHAAGKKRYTNSLVCLGAERHVIALWQRKSRSTAQVAACS